MVPAVNVTVHSVWLMFTLHSCQTFLHAPHIPTHTTHIYICMYTYLAQGHATMTNVCIGGEGHEVVNLEEIQELPIYFRNRRERSWYTADLLTL